MAVVSTVHEQEELVSFLENFTTEDSSIQGGEVPFYIGLTRQQGFFHYYVEPDLAKHYLAKTGVLFIQMCFFSPKSLDPNFIFWLEHTIFRPQIFDADFSSIIKPLQIE